MIIRVLELCEAGHTKGDFWNTRRTFGQESESRQPGCGVGCLHILPKTNIHRVMILRHIPVDVVQSVVAHQDVEFTSEYELQEAHKWADH